MRPIIEDAGSQEKLRQERELAAPLDAAQEQVRESFPDGAAGLYAGSVEHYVALLNVVAEAEDQHLRIARAIWNLKTSWR